MRSEFGMRFWFCCLFAFHGPRLDHGKRQRPAIPEDETRGAKANGLTQ
jgi:hypothetical protein